MGRLRAAAPSPAVPYIHPDVVYLPGSLWGAAVAESRYSALQGTKGTRVQQTLNEIRITVTPVTPS